MAASDNSFSSSAIECPFYKEEDKRVIRCEGLSEAEATHLIFPSRTKREVHQRVFCKDSRGWQDCPLSKMLWQKY